MHNTYVIHAYKKLALKNGGSQGNSQKVSDLLLQF